MRVVNLGNVTAYADAVAAGYTGTREQFAQDLANAATYASEAGTSAMAAEEAASDSEAYAVGKRDGAAVPDTDPAYHNNAKYYAEQVASDVSDAATYKDEAMSAKNTANASAGFAASDALVSEGYAVGTQAEDPVESGSIYYHNNSKYYSAQAGASATAAGTSETNAGSSATAASGSATTASAKALVAEGYAAGTQDGQAVASGSPYYRNSAKYYAEQAEAVAESIPADYTTLSNDVDNLKSDFISKTLKDSTYSSLDFSTSTISYYISPSSNKWTHNGDATSGIYNLPARKVLVVVTAGSGNGNVAFLRTNDHTSNTLPDYATGETERHVVSPGETQSFLVPEDANYLYVQKSTSNGADLTPASIYIYVVPPIISIDASLNIAGEAADAQTTGAKIASINNLTNIVLPFTTEQEDKGINWKTGAVYTASGMAITNYVPVDDYKSIIYRQIHAAIATRPTHGMAFYEDATEASYIMGYNSFYTEDGPAGYVENQVPVPPNANFARFTYRKDTDTYGDFYVYGENVLKGNLDALYGEKGTISTDDCKWLVGLVGMPQKTNGKFNVATRMRMMCDIEWTPIQKVPKQTRVGDTIVQGAFEEKVTQKGIPYGAQLTYEQWMGRNISFETFLSALANPNSVIYNFSRVGTAYRQSAWYSVNCSKAVGWALNIPQTYASGTFGRDPHVTRIATSGNYTASDIHIGDIIEKASTHTAIITDLVYNSFGDLSQIEVSEAVTPVCRRKRWNLYGSFENFWTQFDGYSLLRYEYVDEVPPVDMESMYPYISPSLGLNYGNKSNYQTTDTIEITILDKVSDTLVVKKDGAQVDTIDVTNYEQSAIVTYTQSTPGWYEVGFDGDSSNNYVAFCVNNNSATFDADTSKLTFSSAMSVLYMVSYLKGTSRIHLSDAFPDATDLANGYMILTIPEDTAYIHATFANNYGKTIVEIAL